MAGDATPFRARSQPIDDPVCVTLRRGGRAVEFSATALREATTRLGAFWPRLFEGPQAEVAAMEAVAIAMEDSLHA